MVEAAAIINTDAVVHRQAQPICWIAKLCVLQCCLFRIYPHYTPESGQGAKLPFWGSFSPYFSARQVYGASVDHPVNTLVLFA